MYAVVREHLPSGTRKVTVCGGEVREKIVYTSATSRVEVGVAKSDDITGAPYFMFKYEGGCVRGRVMRALRIDCLVTVICNQQL